MYKYMMILSTSVYFFQTFLKIKKELIDFKKIVNNIQKIKLRK